MGAEGGEHHPAPSFGEGIAKDSKPDAEGEYAGPSEPWGWVE